MTIAPTPPVGYCSGRRPEADEARPWRRWLAAFLLTTVLLGTTLYAGIVLVDPFSTGRFTLMQGVDIASRNARLLKGAVRARRAFRRGDLRQFDRLSPRSAKDRRRNKLAVAQLAIPASLPPSQLLVARTFQRHHSDRGQPAGLHPGRALVPPGRSGGGRMGRISGLGLRKHRPRISVAHPFPEAVTAAARRLAIRAGLMQPPARADGFMPTNLTPVPRTSSTAHGSPVRQSRAGQSFSRAGAACGARCRIAGGCSAGVRVHPALRQHAAGPRQPGRGAAAGLQGPRPSRSPPCAPTPPIST